MSLQCTVDPVCVIIILKRITIFVVENLPKLAPSRNHAKYIPIFQRHNSYSYRIYDLHFSWYFSYFISLKNPTFDSLPITFCSHRTQPFSARLPLSQAVGQGSAKAGGRIERRE